MCTNLHMLNCTCIDFYVYIYILAYTYAKKQLQLMTHCLHAMWLSCPNDKIKFMRNKRGINLFIEDIHM